MEDASNQPTRVVLADDHQMFLDGIHALLQNEGGIDVVGTAKDGEEAWSFLQENEADLLITDISMPGLSGTDLAKKVKETRPGVKVLVVTMYNDYEVVMEILMTEAEGYILKNTDKDELLKAIHKVLDDGTYYSNEVAEIMMQDIRKREKQAGDQRIQQLTLREKEILRLIVQERSSAEIANELYISQRTVDTHRKHIMHKTESKTIVGLIKFALENELA